MRKKKIKINFKYFWEGFDPKNNFFYNFLSQDYDVVISEDPDYMFYSVYNNSPSSNGLHKKGDFIKKMFPGIYPSLRIFYSKLKIAFTKREVVVPEGKSINIFYGAEHTKPDMNKYDWAFSTYFEEEINHPKYMRISNRISDLGLKDFGVPPLNKNINFKKIKKEKSKFCNFIYSQEIPSRNNFFKLLNKYKRVDSPGRCMNNMPPISHKSPRESRLAINWSKVKLRFLKNYKFTIAFENSHKSGWVTEKLTHPMLVNSIPIYIGNKDVNKEFNTKSFINYSDFKDMKDFINFIIKVDNDDTLYKKILNEPWYKDNKIPDSFNNKKLRSRFKEIFR
jgi:hypothetical protein